MTSVTTFAVLTVVTGYSEKAGCDLVTQLATHMKSVMYGTWLWACVTGLLAGLGSYIGLAVLSLCVLHLF